MLTTVPVCADWFRTNYNNLMKSIIHEETFHNDQIAIKFFLINIVS